MTKGERNEYMKQYRRKRIEAGICVRCGKPAAKGRCSCRECLISESERSRIRNRQKKGVQDA